MLDRVKPLQNVGLFGPREVDKNVFNRPIPVFDPTSSDHVEPAALSADAEAAELVVDLNEATEFNVARRVGREQLAAQGIVAVIEILVARIVPAGPFSA